MLEQLLDGTALCHPGSHQASLRAGTCTWLPYLGLDPAPKLPGALGIKCSGPCQGPTTPSGQALDDRTGWGPHFQMAPTNSLVSESSPSDLTH